MKKYLSVLAVSALLFVGCGDMEVGVKHIQSSLAGLNRVVTLYSDNGQVIQQWTGKFKVENHGGSCSFIVDGKTVIVSGTYTVIER